jgi:hypothetical protein
MVINAKSSGPYLDAIIGGRGVSDGFLLKAILRYVNEYAPLPPPPPPQSSRLVTTL